LTKATFARVLSDAQLEAGTATMEGTFARGAEEVDCTGQMELGEPLSDSSMTSEMELPGTKDVDMVLVGCALPT